ncbi:guanine deaminase [Aquabacterium sp.]|uniref:guanine deaminase n=1 Tax=Aquabacterium sp. TaxID=1872578 RepID=UPI0019AE65CD|nr:guanine deaminase [Aquabacterium sp.]MBC7698983.1 guanine deaminase [Aquabacterium sp.]
MPDPRLNPVNGPAVQTRRVLRGDLLDFTADPGFALPAEAPGVRWRPDHVLLIDGERIAAIHPAGDPLPQDWADVPVTDHRGQLIMPGFIDTHVHCPQLDVIASYGAELLDWLNTYTFPAERRYVDPLVAREGAERFLHALWAHGTTSAVVFPTVHKVSAEALFDMASAHHMRLITGKVLMDRHAPEGLLDDVDQAEKDCIDLIDRFHGKARQSFAVTVRFAPTSTPEQLTMAGRLCQTYAGTYMQTHVAENRDEVRWVAELFPTARSYLDVYDRDGLIGPRAVLAHGIWLDANDRAVLKAHGAQIAHSPSSNLFLGSGLFNWLEAEREGVNVSLASDVGGGTSLSMLRNIADAYKIQALQGVRLSAWKALYTCTLGAASHLGLADEIGRLEPDCMADLAVWSMAQGPVAEHRDRVAQQRLARVLQEHLHERIFAWVTMGDERNLVSTYVAGQCVHSASSLVQAAVQ